MAEKKQYQRIQSKQVRIWKEKYQRDGILILYDRFGKASWEMKSSMSRFSSYHAAVPIDDITDFDGNVSKFKSEYPSVLREEIDKMVKAYPDNHRIREDQRMLLKVFGGRK